MAALKKSSILLEKSGVAAMTGDPDHCRNQYQYTCNEYRAEMILLALQHKLQQTDLSERERRETLHEIARLEKIVGLT